MACRWSTDPLGRARLSFQVSDMRPVTWEESRGMLFVGDDWAEAHHDVEIQDDAGRRLVKKRLAEGVAGMAALHELIAECLGEGEPDQVVVGIETDRGPWVQA